MDCEVGQLPGGRCEMKELHLREEKNENIRMWRQGLRQGLGVEVASTSANRLWNGLSRTDRGACVTHKV